MQRLQEFTLSTAEVLNAIEEYLRNVTGILTDKDVRAGCNFTGKNGGGPDEPAATMSFRGDK